MSHLFPAQHRGVSFLVRSRLLFFNFAARLGFDTACLYLRAPARQIVRAPISLLPIKVENDSFLAPFRLPPKMFPGLNADC